jgi:hypothetical protein
MAHFRKYEFDSEEQFNTLFKDLLETLNDTIVVLGELVPNKFCVDVLWHNEVPLNLVKHERWDVKGNGSHTFLGWEFNKE